MFPSHRTRLIGWAVAATLVAGATAWAATRPDPDRTAGLRAVPKAVLHVPRVSAPIVIDAETEGKKAWEGERGKTPNFIDENGHGIVPYTEARLRWSGDELYALLYAGDLDLEATVTQHDGPVERDDSFRLSFHGGSEERVVAVSVLGTVADALCTGSGRAQRCDASWESGVRVAVDKDGSLNKIGDNDEEWVVEMAIPFAALGVKPAPGTRIPFAVTRCEIGHGPAPCGGWGDGDAPGEIVLDP
jgi:hypothetical protein